MAAQLDIALAQITKLTAQIQQEQDTNAVIHSQLSTECDAHSSTRDSVQALQTRLAVTAKERDTYKHTLQTVGKDLQASREIQHTLATTNKTLSRDLSERIKYAEVLEIQTRFQSATDEEAQALMADLAKENVALRASKKSVEG